MSIKNDFITTFRVAAAGICTAGYVCSALALLSGGAKEVTASNPTLNLAMNAMYLGNIILGPKAIKHFLHLNR